MRLARTLLADATQRLGRAGVGSPRVDAELLLAHCLGVTRARLALVDEVPPTVVHDFDRLVARRAGREPLQHLTGSAPFRTIELAVGPGVFVPRPETELLVDAVVPELRARPRPVLVDLCAGSGALALALATEVPGAQVYAVERSADALSWLRHNVERLVAGFATGATVRVLAADVRDPVAAWVGAPSAGTVDALVANPPYVPSVNAVSPEVRADPDEAVFAGSDGLALLPAVIARAAELLRPCGVVAVEHDETHPAAARALLTAADWSEVRTHADLTGRARYLTARRAGTADATAQG